MWIRGNHRSGGNANITNLFRGIAACCLLFGGAFAAPAAADMARPHLALQQKVDAPAGFEGVCARYAWVCAKSGKRTTLGQDALSMVSSVNAAINARTREISDQQQYRRAEYWALPTATGGDCEDFALAKKQALIGKGIAPERLLVATVLDRKRAPHAVLVLRTDDRDYVLDNLTNRIKPWQDTGYTFLRMQTPSAPGAWSAVLAGGMLSRPGN